MGNVRPTAARLHAAALASSLKHVFSSAFVPFWFPFSLLFCPLLFCPLQRLLNVQLFRWGFRPHFVSFLFGFLSSLTAFNRSAGALRREACTHASKRSFYLYGAFFFLERILSGLLERVFGRWTVALALLSRAMSP
jgi:hypothetical protein